MGTIRERSGKKGKSYQVQVRRNGYEAVNASFRVKAQAQQWARGVEAEMDAGKFVSGKAAKNTSLMAALEKYKTEVTPTKKGVAQELSVIKMLMALPLAHRSMSMIRSSDVASLRDHWLKVEKLQPSTVCRRLSVLSKLFTTCRTDWKDFSGLYNVVRDVSRPKINDERQRVVEQDEPADDFGDDDDDLDDDEVEDRAVLLSERTVFPDEMALICNVSESKILKVVVPFAVETALRRSEIVALEWRYVSLRKSVARIPTSKNGRAREIPLSPLAKQILQGLLPRRDGPIFDMRADSVTRAFSRALVRAREAHVEACEEKGERPSPTLLLNLRFHDLRHEATTRLAQIFALHELCKITGHKTPRMLLRYYHPKAADLAKRFPPLPVKT